MIYKIYLIIKIILESNVTKSIYNNLYIYFYKIYSWLTHLLIFIHELYFRFKSLNLIGSDVPTSIDDISGREAQPKEKQNATDAARDTRGYGQVMLGMWPVWA